MRMRLMRLRECCTTVPVNAFSVHHRYRCERVGGGLLHNVLSIVPFVGGRSACWGSRVALEASCALRMVCSHLLLLTGVLTLFTVIVVCGSLFKFVVMRGGFQSPCLVLEPAHGGGNGSRSPPRTINIDTAGSSSLRQRPPVIG